MEFIFQHHIVIIGVIFMTILLGMTWLTHQEKQWIKQHYKKEDIIALGFGITCYGLSSDEGKPKKNKGLLLVHKQGLLFKGRFSNTIFDIPAGAIKKVYHANEHKNTKLYQSAVMVDFLTTQRETDTIAFKLAYPPQWIKIIGKTFIETPLEQKRVSSTSTTVSTQGT
jgi:hypothetical protein